MKTLVLTILLSGCLLSESEGQCDLDFEPNSHACRALLAPDPDAGTVTRADAAIPPTQLTCADDFVAGTGRVSSGSLGSTRQTPCGGIRARLTTVQWVAPSSGPFAITTNGSSFDTILGLRVDACQNLVLGCDDDGGTGGASQLSIMVVAGRSYLFSIEGYQGETGNYVLNISPL